MKKNITALALVLSTLGLSELSKGADELPADLKDAGIVEKLGAQIDTQQIMLRDEAGVEKPLGQYFIAGKPVVLNLVYFECPSLCSLALNGMVDGVKQIQKWTPGEQYTILSVSIDPDEDGELASSKKANYLKQLGKPIRPEGWRFLTGTSEQVKKLAEQVGFGYRWDEASQQYAHSAALIFLTPDGRVSRYLHGIQYQENDLKMAFLEASQGRIGNIVEKVLMYCYQYNSASKGYGIYAMGVMRIASIVTLIFLSIYLILFWTRQRRSNMFIGK